MLVHTAILTTTVPTRWATATAAVSAVSDAAGHAAALPVGHN